MQYSMAKAAMTVTVGFHEVGNVQADFTIGVFEFGHGGKQGHKARLVDDHPGKKKSKEQTKQIGER